MTGKEAFITEMREILDNNPEMVSIEALTYFFDVLAAPPKEINTKLSDNAKEILAYLKERGPNVYCASKDIGDAIGKSGRSVSGSIRKLVQLEYVEKNGKDPVTYAITEIGMNIE